MLEQLMDLIKQNAGDAVTNNPEVPNEHNDAVIAEAGHSIIGGLKNAGSEGGGGLMDTIKGVFSR